MQLLVGMVLLGALVLIDHHKTVHGYTINYYDCHDTNRITTYKLGEACMTNKNNNSMNTEYALLQERSITELTGFSCWVTHSTLTEYCGAYSHNKLAKAPEIEVNEALTPDQCLNLVNTQSYTTPDK